MSKEKAEEHLNINGEKLRLVAYDKNSIAFMKWLKRQKAFKEGISDMLKEEKERKNER